MADDHARAFAKLADAVGHALNGLDAVVQKINLSAARKFSVDGVADHAFVVAADDGLDRLTVRRRGFDHRHVPRAHEREVKRARNWRGREREHIDEAEFFLQRVLVFHAEALLLVHHDEAEVFEMHIRGNDAVRADDDIHTAVGEGLDHAALLGGGAVAAEKLDGERILAHALAEVLPMLLRQHRGGRNNCGLLAAGYSLERRADGDLGFSKTHIAADEAVHRAGRFHVLLRLADGAELVGRFSEKKRALEFLLPVRIGGKGITLLRLSLGLHLEHAGRVIVDAARGFFLRLAPAPRAEFREVGMFFPEADITRDLPRLIERHIEAGFVGKFQNEHIARAVGGFFQTLVAPDAVVEMHHQIALLELRKIHRMTPGAHPFAPQCGAVGALTGRATQNLGLRKNGELLGRTHEAARGRRGQKDDLRGVEVKIRRQFSEPLPFALVGAGEGNRPAVGGPCVELVEKPVALGFVQHQIASREIAERRRVEFQRRTLLRGS